MIINRYHMRKVVKQWGLDVHFTSCFASVMILTQLDEVKLVNVLDDVLLVRQLDVVSDDYLSNYP